MRHFVLHSKHQRSAVRCNIAYRAFSGSSFRCRVYVHDLGYMTGILHVFCKGDVRVRESKGQGSEMDGLRRLELTGTDDEDGPKADKEGNIWWTLDCMYTTRTIDSSY